MGKTFLVELIKVANELDSRGLVKEADLLDKITNNSLEAYGLTLSTASLVKSAVPGGAGTIRVLKWIRGAWTVAAVGKRLGIVAAAAVGTGISEHFSTDAQQLGQAAGIPVGSASTFDTTDAGKMFEDLLAHLMKDDVCNDLMIGKDWPASSSEASRSRLDSLLRRRFKNGTGYGPDTEGTMESIFNDASEVMGKTCTGWNKEEPYGELFEGIFHKGAIDAIAQELLDAGADFNPTKTGWMCDMGKEIGWPEEDTGECPNAYNVGDWFGSAEARLEAMQEEAKEQELDVELEEDSQIADLKDQIAGLDAELGETTDTDGLTIAQLEGHLRRLEREQERIVSEEGAPRPQDDGWRNREPEPEPRDPFEPFELEPKPEPEPEPQAPNNDDWQPW